MFRKIENKLVAWKESTKKKALLITGARQIGKTYIIREFAKKYYEHLIEINFIVERRLKDLRSACKDDPKMFLNI